MYVWACMGVAIAYVYVMFEYFNTANSTYVIILVNMLLILHIIFDNETALLFTNINQVVRIQANYLIGFIK